MMRNSGVFMSLVAAAVLAAFPAGAARAEVAPPAPLADDVAGPAAATPGGGDPADLQARLVRAGLPAEEARVLVARLGPEERELLAGRVDGAEVGGFAPAMIAVVPFLVFAGIFVAVMAIVGAIRAAGAEDAPDAGGPSPERPETPAGAPARP